MIIIREAAEKKIPYDLVSILAILRDYAEIEDSDYVNDEHRLLVDIADSIYNISPSIVKQFEDEYKEVYDKYGNSYFNKVIKDMRALDSQINTDNVNDLIDEFNDKLSSFGYSVSESYLMHEEDAKIEVKHEGILEVPEGKNVDDLPMSHFEKLAKKKGLGKITKALNNLQVWNKNDDPKLSKWAGNMIDKLNKKLKKDEAVTRTKRRTATRSKANSNSVGRWLDKQIESGKIDEKQITVVYDKNNNIMWLGKAGFYPIYMSNIDFRSSGYDADHPHELWINARSYTTPFEESINRTRSHRLKESGHKSYWKYNYMNLPDDMDGDGFYHYYDRNSIRLIPCDNPDDCYTDTTQAVCSYEYPYNEVFCTKDEAYEYLMASLNNSTFEREHDI